MSEAGRMLQVVEHLLEEKTIDQSLVAELALSLEELMEAQLGPNEAFLATRVNGVWSIRDIVSISPFTEDECLAIFANLFKRGILRVAKPMQGGAQAR